MSRGRILTPAINVISELFLASPSMERILDLIIQIRSAVALANVHNFSFEIFSGEKNKLLL